MAKHHVRFTSEGGFIAHLELDGKDISAAVTDCTITRLQGKPTEVTLRIIPHSLEFDSPADVRIVGICPICTRPMECRHGEEITRTGSDVRDITALNDQSRVYRCAAEDGVVCHGEN